ncbi:LysR substrate-binding domain-containing protein [Sulfitobacter porphyrae]|uniref:LysR substrate-binding domain-containing protein n=1 Tax=Sulfitobacter porphyrae TaxID=1246864 RepID=A0ABW2B5D6_9RHOB|nr:LysR family transcriptional regulator [Sulfitobacter porphyrae]
MLRPSRISLNAIRVFVLVAEHGSLKRAAEILHVTPGAVSRQISSLEDMMGVRLFRRSNNSLHLSETGEAFFQQVRPSIHSLHRAIELATGESRAVNVQAPTTMASRWLIPALVDFKKRWPDIKVSISTHDSIGLRDAQPADLYIAYSPASDPLPGGDILIEDRCRPYLAPQLLSQIVDPSDLSSIPALQSTGSNWDWTAWLQHTETPDIALRFDNAFDLDDVAIRAAIAGMGMVLAPKFIIHDDVDAGRLCALPQSPEVLLGYYSLHMPEILNADAKTFIRWLKDSV